MKEKIKEFLKNIFGRKIVQMKPFPRFTKLFEEMERDVSDFKKKTFSSPEEENEAFIELKKEGIKKIDKFERSLTDEEKKEQGF